MGERRTSSEQAGDDGRLDAFVDAAFAFAVTLLVIGGGAVPQDYAGLSAAVASAPAFAIGFSIIAMFWHAHVRWRRIGGRPGGLSVWLSLLLVFLVLVYVYPLRLMAQTLADYVTGAPMTVGQRDFGSFFAIYGMGFAAMAGCVAALFGTVLPVAEAGTARATARGEITIWLMLAATGVVSALLTRVAPQIAPWAYAVLPWLIGAYAWRHDWTGGETS